MGSCVLQSENKMKLIVFLATVVLVSAKSIKIDQLEYGFCEGADTSVGTIDAADVQPFPVEVKTGATVTISATLTLAATVQTGSTVSLNIIKEGIVDLPPSPPPSHWPPPSRPAPPSPSTSSRRVSLICPSLAWRSRVCTLVPALTTLTTC